MSLNIIDIHISEWDKTFNDNFFGDYEYLAI